MWLAALAVAVALAACNQGGRPPEGTAPPPQPSVAAQPAVAVQPANVPVSGSYTVVAGDTVYGVANRFGVPIRSLIDVNGLVPPFRLAPGQVLQIPDQRVHIVAQDETVYGISRLYGVDSSTLVRMNGIEPPFTLYPGQTLVLPAPIEPVSVASTAAVTSAPLAEPAVLAEEGTSAGGTSGETVSMPTPTEATQGLEAPPVVLPGASTGSTAAAPPPAKPGTDAAADTTGPLILTDQPEQEPVTAPATDPATEPAETQTAAVDPMLIEPAARSEARFLWPVNGKVVSEFGGKADGLHNDGINIAAPLGTPVRATENGVVVYAGNELRGFGNLLLIRHADGWVSAYAHNESLLVTRGETVKRGQTIARVGASGNVPSPQLHFELRRGTEAVDPREYLDSGA